MVKGAELKSEPCWICGKPTHPFLSDSPQVSFPIHTHGRLVKEGKAHASCIIGAKYLQKKVDELTMADMTHEYNNAEAERFAPEYEEQIKRPFVQTIGELQEFIKWYTGMEREDFDAAFKRFQNEKKNERGSTSNSGS